MNFLIIPFFLILMIASLSIIFIYNLQIINPQPDTNSPSLANISVKITSPSEGKKVPTGKLTISGTSSDNQEKNCIVFVDWNDLKPFQPVRAAGPGGVDDFSKWIFIYDSNYHEIIEGNNELTSKITCLDGNKPLTKWNSINVTGYTHDSKSLSVINQNTTSAENRNNQQQVPLQTVMPGSNPKTNATDKVIEQNNTSLQLLSIVLPVVEKNTTSAENRNNQQQVPLQTVMPGSNPKTNATDKVIEQNNTSLQLSNPNITAVEKNTTGLQLSNLSDSEIEMVVPNESINEKQINNTNTNSISKNGKSNIKNFTTSEFSQFTSQNPRIDLDEQPPPQPPTALEEEQQQQQEQQELPPPPQPPTALEEEQQQQQEQQELPPPPQPPTALEEEQQQQQEQQELPPPPPQPPNLNNQSEAFEAQPPQSENSPTKGMFPPLNLPSLFP